jgi:hypothetical protein
MRPGAEASENDLAHKKRGVSSRLVWVTRHFGSSFVFARGCRLGGDGVNGVVVRSRIVD